MKLLSVCLFICASYQVQASFYSTIASLKGYVAPACMTLSQLDNATAILCAQKNNAALWQAVIDCHQPIDEDVTISLFEIFFIFLYHFSLSFLLFKTPKKIVFMSPGSTLKIAALDHHFSAHMENLFEENNSLVLYVL